MTVQPLRIALVDDADLASAGLGALLAPYGERVVLVDLREALARPASLDVILFEPLGQSGMSGSLLRDLQAGGAAQAVVFSWASRDQLPVATTTAWLPKSLAAAQLVVALEELVAGRYRESKRVDHAPLQSAVVHEVSATPEPTVGSSKRPVGILTPRESEIVSLIVAGCSNREISESLVLSGNSVKTYIRSAYRKMGITRRTQAVLWGLDHGLGAGSAEAQPALVG